MLDLGFGVVMSDSYRPIEEYAIIGDCASAALVSRNGSIDWLCLPSFDSPPLFWRLLDAAQGGYFRIGPTAETETSRRYVEATNVLETTFTSASGTVRLTDLMYAAHQDQYHEKLLPEHQILRKLECLSGEVEVELSLAARPNFGRSSWRCQSRGALGSFIEHGEEAIFLRSDLDVCYNPQRDVFSGVATLRAGDSAYTTLSFDRDEPAVLLPLGATAGESLAHTLGYWRDWSNRCSYDGPFRDPVMRSALTLKLMASSATGAIVAAPTTSLPEKIGGVRNWDYRYCWIRDAAFTMRALLDLGYDEEGEAFFGWLSYAARRSAPDVSILYTIHGRSDLETSEIQNVEGYKNSLPVRLGNNAVSQFQLDVYGELVCATVEYVKRGGTLNKWQTKLLAELGEVMCERWSSKDNGIWEKQSERLDHTYSKVMCWVGLDRLIRMHDQGLLDAPRDRFAKVKEEIEQAVEQKGFYKDEGCFSATFECFEMDSNLMLLALYGYEDASTERMRRTYERLRRELGAGPLLYRYKPDGRDGLPPGEGAFGVCSFWAVEYLARRGDIEAAEHLFKDLLDYGNDVGLFSEEIDPESGRLLGNFPQALTHVGVINAALTLAEARGERKKSGLENLG